MAQNKESLLSSEIKAFALGLGLGILAMAVFPQVRERVIPVTEGAVQGVKELFNGFTGVTQNLREGLEDLIAEAKLEELKQAIDKDIAAVDHGPAGGSHGREADGSANKTS